MDKNTAEKNKIMIRRFYYELLNQQDFSLIDDFFAPRPSIIFSGLIGNDRAWISALLERFYAAVPTPHFELMIILAEGDMVCASWKMIAKPIDCQGFETYNGICLFKMKANKVIQLNHQSDLHRIFDPIELVHKQSSARCPKLTPELVI